MASTPAPVSLSAPRAMTTVLTPEGKRARDMATPVATRQVDIQQSSPVGQMRSTCVHRVQVKVFLLHTEPLLQSGQVPGRHKPL